MKPDPMCEKCNGYGKYTTHTEYRSYVVLCSCTQINKWIIAFVFVFAMIFWMFIP